MKIQMQPMGAYQTNCYILSHEGKDFIIDPGVGATDWVIAHTSNPVAILNTHGHFDHVWSNAELKERLQIPIYAPVGDCFMLAKDPFSQGTPPSQADVAVAPDETVTIEGVDFTFLHFPGHTPGCSAIWIDDLWFCGDFLFKHSIGRVDFPYSDPQAMKESLQKAKSYPDTIRLLPGHGPQSTLGAEKASIDSWITLL